MPTTLKDVAKRVGKSVPTVSRALGGFPDISPRTRAEVQRVAQEMGYEPSATATNLKKRRANDIALVMPNEGRLRLSDPFFSEFVNGVIDQVAQHGFGLTIASNTGDDECATYVRYIRSRRTDGFVVVRVKHQDARIDLLRGEEIPFVAFGHTDGDDDYHWVDDDGAYGIRQAVDHLVALGHTRLAFIAEPAQLTKAQHRLNGFRTALAAHNLPDEPALIAEANFRQTSGRHAARHLLDLPQPPTAIVASNDLLALGAMSEVQSRGLVVGHHVSITGFDDIMLAEYAHPPLTTLRQSAQEIGMAVADMLVKVINKQLLPEKHILRRPQLIVRQSTGPQPSST
jgi:LacI family transcriptional regulator